MFYDVKGSERAEVRFKVLKVENVPYVSYENTVP